jgi:hypothetical protein
MVSVGVGRGGDMSHTRFQPSWDEKLSQNLQAVADQGCHLEGSSPYKGTDYRAVYCNYIIREYTVIILYIYRVCKYSIAEGLYDVCILVSESSRPVTVCSPSSDCGRKDFQLS